MDDIEIYQPPAFEYGTRVRALTQIRNDGTFPGADRGQVLVEAGEEGYVRSLGTFLQTAYVYGVDFIDSGRVVGMRAHELAAVDPAQPEETPAS
ncbi:nitrogen fixation protein NifZ [Roseospirillum parvum]|uniref:Nitrogen fixation protein NifZ n=1 Tax=Roseospirillum parvum TaxID=83401 RepID=A0A1G7XXN5_9PROT|nr:nitrogen fixation protein NifZ [Roseospirillum parvum]SDG88944.1 nitrogen fixation protein NifZ [Roseospirillum parvum]